MGSADIRWRWAKDVVAEVSIKQESESVVHPQAVSKDRQWIGEPVGSDQNMIIGLDNDVRLSSPANCPQIESNSRLTALINLTNQVDAVRNCECPETTRHGNEAAECQRVSRRQRIGVWSHNLTADVDIADWRTINVQLVARSNDQIETGVSMREPLIRNLDDPLNHEIRGTGCLGCLALHWLVGTPASTNPLLLVRKIYKWLLTFGRCAVASINLGKRDGRWRDILNIDRRITRCSPCTWTRRSGLACAVVLQLVDQRFDVHGRRRL